MSSNKLENSLELPGNQSLLQLSVKGKDGEKNSKEQVNVGKQVNQRSSPDKSGTECKQKQMQFNAECSDSDSSIDAGIDGTMDQRVDGPPDCYCSNPTFVREVQKKLLRKELSCSICLQMLVKPVTLQCGHTFCRHCLLTCILKKNHLGCGICRFENVLQHPLDIRVNVLLDGVTRQLNPKVYMRNLKLQQEEERKNQIREKLLELFPYDINFAQKQIE